MKKENESLKRRLKPNTNPHSVPRHNNDTNVNQNYDDVNGYESIDGNAEEVKLNKNTLLEPQNSNVRKQNGPANLQT